jgi:hypothetical protein
MSTLVSPFAGAASEWLCTLDPVLVPPVSWMGGKRRLAPELLRLLGLEPGRPVPTILGDASWWGWLWPGVLDAETGPQVSAWLRSWRDEDPRELWFRLRDAGPPDDLVERAAGLLWLQARAASGVPVWWEGEGALVQWASTKIDAAGQRQAQETRNANAKGFHGGGLRAGGRGDRAVHSTVAGHKGKDSRGGGGIVDPGTVATRLDAIRARAEVCPGLVVEHRGAIDLTSEWAPILGDRVRVLLDPPYQNKTGYPATCPRSEVLTIARAWANAGAVVVLCEAEGLAADLGPGWDQVQLRAGRRPEWVTTYGARVEARHGELFAAVAR